MQKLEVTTLFGTVYFAGFKFDAKKNRKVPVFVNPNAWFFGKMPKPVIFHTLKEMHMLAKKMKLDQKECVVYYLLVPLTDKELNDAI